MAAVRDGRFPIKNLTNAITFRFEKVINTAEYAKLQEVQMTRKSL